VQENANNFILKNPSCHFGIEI